MKVLVLFFTTFTLSFSPIFDSALSLNVYADNGEMEKAKDKITAQCNGITDTDMREECLNTVNTKFGEVGLGDDIDYSKVGVIDSETGDYLEDEVFMLFLTNLIALISNIIFVAFMGGYKIPSSYVVMLSAGWFITTYFGVMGEVKEILEKSISKIKGEAAGNLKFEMTGDMSKDREAYQLLIAQEEHLRKASELLTELYEAQEMSVMFMWIASIIAGIEATICAFTGMAWCAPTPVQNINAEPNKHYVLNKLLKLLPLKIEGAHAYDTNGKSSKDDYSFWYHLILQIVSNVGLKVGEKLLLQQFAKKARDSAGKKIAFFLRPALYAADALNLEDQGDMIEIEKDAFRERAKLVAQLIEKLESVFDSGNGSIGSGGPSPQNPGLEISDFRLDVGDSGEEVESMDGPHSEEIKEMKRKYPKISPQKVDTYSSMVGEDLQNLFKVSEESFPNAPGKDLDVDDNSDNFAKKAKAIDKMLVAKAKKNGIMIPPLEDRIKAANEERKKMASNFLKNQSPQGLAKLRNLSMFSDENLDEKEEKLKEDGKKEFMAIPDIDIPEVDLGGIKIDGLVKDESPEEKEEDIEFPNFDSIKKNELSKYKLNSMDIYNNKNADIFKVITSRYIKSAYRHFFDKDLPKKKK